MEEKVYQLLKYLDSYDTYTKLDKELLPVELKSYFSFTFNKSDKSDLHYILLDLKNKDWTESGSMNEGWKIKKEGQIALLREMNERQKSGKLESLQLEELKLSIQKLKDELGDYPKVRRQINRNEIILWIGIGLTVISIIISLLK